MNGIAENVFPSVKKNHRRNISSNHRKTAPFPDRQTRPTETSRSSRHLPNHSPICNLGESRLTKLIMGGNPARAESGSVIGNLVQEHIAFLTSAIGCSKHK